MNYLVFSEMMFLAVYAFEVFRGGGAVNNLYLLFALIYACLKLLLYVFYDKKIRKALSIIVLLYVGVIGWFYYPITLFFPMSLNQTNLLTIKKGWAVSLVSLLWLFVLPTDFMVEFLLIFGFSTLMLFMQKEHLELNRIYEDKIDDLERSNSRIAEQLDSYSQVTENITYQSQLEERNKLSQTLHDELGHTLSGNILRLEAVKLVLDKDTDKSKKMTQEVIDNLRSGMDSIRDILKAAKPEVSTVNIANLKLIIDKVKQQSDVNIKLNYNSDVSHINQSMWQAIIPNIKEALTNMMKYSQAENCEIEFAKLNKIYRVKVKDDGIGCKSVSKGLGMVGIEERMALIGGNAIFDGGNGFSVTMIFPV